MTKCALPFGDLNNLVLTHLDEQFRMLLNDVVPARFLGLRNQIVFNLKEPR